MGIVRAAELELGPDEVGRVAARFGVRAWEPLGGYENLMFRSMEPRGVILRVTHTSRRSLDQVLGEFEFLEHLGNEGAAVVRPLRSEDDELCVEWTSEKGERVLTVAMSEAPGAHKPPGQWQGADVETYGRMLGELHEKARGFEPSRPECRRPDWFDPKLDPGFGDDPLRERFGQLIERARALPAGGTDLLIHQDAHHGNLHLTDEGRMTFFDFDDCAYGTETHDLAICLFYRFFGVEDLSLAAIRDFARPFLRGYESVQPLPEDWPIGVDEFLSLREVTLLFLVQSVSEKRAGVLRFIQRAQQNVQSDTPCLGMPAEAWAMR